MEKDKYCMISLIWGNLKKKLIETEQTGGQQSFVRAGGNWVERAKRRKRAAVGRSGGDVQHADYSHHTILHLKVAKRVDLKSCPHKKKMLQLYEVIDVK